MNDPAGPDAMSQWVKAMRAERYEAAWALAERLLKARDPAMRDDPAMPYHLRWVWDGRGLAGKHVLVRCYHGLGDTLQHARFLPALAKRAASVTVEAQPALIPLLKDFPGVARWIPFDPIRPAPPSECDVEITELDFALRLPPQAAPMPYLRKRRALLPKRTVALCHQAGEWDRERSLPAEMVAPLCRMTRCLTLSVGPTRLPVLNPEGCPADMETTAAFVASADLVITVDTMVAHLAGALGRPTWLLLKARPDWRWAPDRPVSAWYPSVRLYVQSRAGDWPGVLARVERDLARGDHLAAER